MLSITLSPLRYDAISACFVHFVLPALILTGLAWPAWQVVNADRMRDRQRENARAQAENQDRDDDEDEGSGGAQCRYRTAQLRTCCIAILRASSLKSWGSISFCFIFITELRSDACFVILQIDVNLDTP